MTVTSADTLIAVADIGVGTLAGWLTLLAVGALGYLLWKGQTGAAVGYLSTTNQALKQQNAEQAQQIAALERKNADLVERIANLEGRTDFTVALAPMTQWGAEHELADERRHQDVAASFQVVTQALERHEERAQTRADDARALAQKMLVVLDLIAERHGPEPNGHLD